jgi:hypothetical protein
MLDRRGRRVALSNLRAAFGDEISRKEQGRSSLLTLVIDGEMPVNWRRISRNFFPAGITSPFVARAMPTRSSDKRLRKYANLAAAAAPARV